MPPRTRSKTSRTEAIQETKVSAQSIALITGANSGLGFGICQRLLDTKPDIKIVLACRSEIRAEKARDDLKKQHPKADIDILAGCDTLSIEALYRTCDEFKRRYTRLDYFFANAGAGSFIGVNWPKAIWDVVTKLHSAVTFPEFKIQSVGDKSKDGLGWAFQCNFFGHYVMLRELQELMASCGGRIIWSSSLEAKIRFFDKDDLQCLKTQYSYESSKVITDIVAQALNEKSSTVPKPRVLSIDTDPGIVSTSIFSEFLPFHLDKLMEAAFYVARWTGSPNHPITAYKGAISNVHAALLPADQIDPFLKYGSKATALGKPYVGQSKVDFYDTELGLELVEKCEALKREFDAKFDR